MPARLISTFEGRLLRIGNERREEAKIARAGGEAGRLRYKEENMGYEGAGSGPIKRMKLFDVRHQQKESLSQGNAAIGNLGHPCKDQSALR